MAALGIIFSDIHEWNMGELTAARPIASLPFAGRYWLIDFVLSNMINSGVHKVGVITKSNYQSLMGHIGPGKDWDLSRKNGGITILPPYGEGGAPGLYKGRLDALMRILNYINSDDGEFVILSDCDFICTVNYKQIIDHHIKTKAEITAVYHEHYVDRETAAHSIFYNISKLTGRVVDTTVNPQHLEGTYKTSMNTWVMRKEFLVNLLTNAMANGKTKFSRDILLAEVDNINIIGYEYKGYCAYIDSIKNYVRHNMEMLDINMRNGLFYHKGNNVYTKVRDSEPTKYGSEASISNSLIADGCVIDGKVENSVLSRGVKVEKNSTVKNCIIMQDSIISHDCEIEWVISDKNVVIKPHKKLIADKEYLLYITKSKMI